MPDRRVNLQKRAQIEQIALGVTWATLPSAAPKELHWVAMDAVEAAIAPRSGRGELSEAAMVEVARRVVTDLCRAGGFEPLAA